MSPSSPASALALHEHTMRTAARQMARTDGWEYLVAFTISAVAGFTLALLLDRRFNPIAPVTS